MCAALASIAFPAALVLSYAPSALQEARACLPPPAAGWRSLSLLHHEGKVATDGFVAIAGVTDLEDAELVGSLQLVVTDEAGAEVAGQITVLSPEPDQGGRRLLGWSAAEALSLGAKLTARLDTERVSTGTDPDEIGQELMLVVVGEPTELSAGAPSFGAWGTFSRGVGEQAVSCMAGVSGCGAGLPPPPHDLPSRYGYGVPSDEVRVRSAITYWQLPEIRGNVAWEAALVLVGDATGAVLPDERPIAFSSAGAQDRPPLTGLVVFPAEPDTYCIALRVRDLRTGDEAQSDPVCAEPRVSEFTIADTALRNCAMPPNEALAQTWCEMHPGSSLRQCQSGFNGASDKGGSGSGGSGSGGGGSTGNDDSPAVSSRSADGCSVKAPAGNSGAARLGLLGLAVGLLRRRK